MKNKIILLIMLLTVGLGLIATWFYLRPVPEKDEMVPVGGTLWAWGWNFGGQLGLGDFMPFMPQDIPIQVGIDINWKLVATGNAHAVAIKTDGTLWTWGWNAFGQLGLEDTVDRRTPVQVGTSTDWKKVAAGNAHTVAIKTDGTLWAWGGNCSGQLGLGDAINRYIPIQIGTDTEWKMVVAGPIHIAAIKADGTIWVWGDNSFGQLGLGDIKLGINRYIPTQVGTDTDWKSVAAGGTHTVAIKTDGTLWAWGDNKDGQLGVGDNISRYIPTQVGTDTDWKSVATGSLYSLGIKKNNTLWAWGWNGQGQLGLGDTTDRYSPVQVGIDADWEIVVAGAAHTAAIKTDGTLWVWGWNRWGQLGLGLGTEEDISKYIPIQVGTNTDWKMITAMVWHTLAIKEIKIK